MRFTRFRITLLTLLLLPFMASHAQESKPASKAAIRWYSFEEAYELNKKKPKKIFVDVYTNWCGWCKRMDQDTFSDPEIAKYMQKHFYCVKLNAERKDTVVLDGVKLVNPNPGSRNSTHQLANELLRNKMSYPSFVFLNEKGNQITAVGGYQKPEGFIVILNFIGGDHYLKESFESFKGHFQPEGKEKTK